MTKNIADNERIFRVVAGGLITSMAFWGPENNLFLLGLVPLVTGIFGTCPLYFSLGFSSIPNEQHRAKRKMRKIKESKDPHYH